MVETRFRKRMQVAKCVAKLRSDLKAAAFISILEDNFGLRVKTGSLGYQSIQMYSIA